MGKSNQQRIECRRAIEQLDDLARRSGAIPGNSGQFGQNMTNRNIQLGPKVTTCDGLFELPERDSRSAPPFSQRFH
ncbi:MAG: hypothetical protein DCC65_18020 [Planctomycetota bacterium]|nr:MAG: hypothetical protein DCC65_18020 [Planctomycetota bacterium]